MSPQAYIPTMLARISQPRREARLLLALDTSQLELCISHSTPSPQNRFFAWQGAAEDDGERTARFTHSLHLQPDRLQMSPSGSTAGRLHRHPERHRVLQTSVSVKHHLSSIFPAHPRSLARCLSRALRQLRGSASAYAALRVSAFRKSS